MFTPRWIDQLLGSCAYYSIPRQMATRELADEFGISDQAVTERFRRAIETLTENTLIATEDELEEDFDQAHTD